MHFCRLVFPLMCLLIACMGGCFGSCIRPETTIPFGETSNRLKIQDQTAEPDNLADEFSSTIINPLTCTAPSTSNSSEFVNQGLFLWHQTRQQWLAKKVPCNKNLIRDPVISWNVTYESLLGSSERFPKPIPLPEMVDFLVDTWDHEGLYD